MKLATIDSFQKDSEIQGFYLVREKHRRVTRTDRPYLQLVLQDRTSSIEAKIWENVPAFEKTFEQGDAVVVKGRVTSYQDKLQLEIEDIGQATEEKHKAFGFDPLNLIPATKGDIEEMWKALTAQIRAMGNSHLKQLVGKLYKKHSEIIKIHPASMTLHHAVYGGFLEHVHSMAKLVPVLAAHYGMDEDLLLAGVLLHDIGKVRELQPAASPGYTDEGQLIGHIVIGHEMVRDTIATLKGFPEELRLKVLHMVLAHQGRYEWQSPKRPKFPEALLLHYLDEMDARLQMMNEIVTKDQESGSWTNRYNYFKLPLLKGSLDIDDADSE